MNGLTLRELVTEPEQIKAKVQDAYRTIGHLLNDFQESALLVDALCLDCPIVGATPGFCELSGYSLDQVLGQNCRMMLQGVPEVAVSRSARKNLRNYCSMYQVAGLTDIAEVTTIQANVRRNGSHFVNFFMLGLCRVRDHHYILGVQLPLSEGLMVQVSSTENARVMETVRGIFKHIRERLQAKASDALGEDEGGDGVAPCFQRQAVVAQPDFAFFAERLQDHCLLLNNGFTAIRREPQEVAFNCLVFGDRPVQRTSQGLSFTVHVDEVTPSFRGLPILGFTKRRPADEPELYPTAARCLGSSVLVGACGEAFARDKHEHFKMKFKQPLESEVQTWALRKDLPPHKREPPAEVKPGDLLHCIYLLAGRIQLKVNENTILDFDVERAVDEDADYYAVVDVCFSAYSLTIMPSPQQAAKVSSNSPAESQVQSVAELSFLGGVSTTPESPTQQTLCSTEETPQTCHTEGTFSPQISSAASDEDSLSRHSTGSAIEPSDLSTVVDEVLVKKGIREAIRECKFMVTIADPRGKDCPLIAVSDEFESMTGYRKNEILGANCRFLNQGCDMDPSDLANLRMSSATGVPFTAVIPNRKKSGELFLNLLDVRGLSVATDPKTGDDLWFLIGIQADVTELMDYDAPKEDHIADLQVVSDAIRVGISKELSQMAVAGHARTEGDLASMDMKSTNSWRLRREPSWRHESSLGNRHPLDSPLADQLAREARRCLATVGESCEHDNPKPDSSAAEEHPKSDNDAPVPANRHQMDSELFSPKLLTARTIGSAAVGIGLGVVAAHLLKKRKNL